MEALAAWVAREQTAVKGELLTSPIRAIGLPTTLTMLTLEVRGPGVNRARIAREVPQGLEATRELKEVTLAASRNQEELWDQVQTASQEPIAWIMEAKVRSGAKKAWASSILTLIPPTARPPGAVVRATILAFAKVKFVQVRF